MPVCEGSRAHKRFLSQFSLCSPLDSTLNFYLSYLFLSLLFHYSLYCTLAFFAQPQEYATLHFTANTVLYEHVTKYTF